MSFITTRTPFRISFMGGGTDYPQWYSKEGGAVISSSIDKYCYLTCRYLPPFFPTAHRIVWSHIENVSSISDILHPAIRGCLQHMGFTDDKGIEIHHHSDLPARSGMGSSSAFVNGLILALTELRGGKITQEELYKKSVEMEQEILKENVGSQDQVASAVGGLNFIRFQPDGEIIVDPIQIEEKRLGVFEDNLMLVYTGVSRHSSKIAEKLLEDMEAKKSELHKMRSMVDETLSVLTGHGNLDEFGELLHESWILKRSLSKVVSNDTIDDIYNLARGAGALGGKLLGAGSSGFMLFYVRKDQQEAVVEALKNYLHVDFRFENEGAKTIRYG